MRISFYLFFIFSCAQNLFCEQHIDHCEGNKVPLETSHSFEFNEEQVQAYHNEPSDDMEEIREIINTGFFANSKEILDVGCGDGQLTAAFATHLPHASIIGCDISRTKIEHALKHHVSFNLNFVEKNAENLAFEKQFDTVVSFNCLHWIENQKRAIDQIYNILKPGGKAFLVATPDSSNDDFKKICRKVILSFRWLPYFVTFRSAHSFHTEKEYKKLLNNAGFSIDKIETKSTEMVFKDRNELEVFLQKIPPLQHLDPKKRPAFLDDFYRELNKLGRVDANGSIHIFSDQIELVVSKRI